MSDLVGNPEDGFSCIAAHEMCSQKTCHQVFCSVGHKLGFTMGDANYRLMISDLVSKGI